MENKRKTSSEAHKDVEGRRCNKRPKKLSRHTLMLMVWASKR